MAQRTNLELVSLLAPNADGFYDALADWLGQATGLAIGFRSRLALSEREALVAGGGPVLVAMCGGLFARRGAADGLEAIAAPIFAGKRYGGRPVFYSDLVVSRRSSAASLADLRDQVFAFNGTDSLSGFDVVRDRLRALGGPTKFFRAEILSGSHQASLDMVASGLADVAAIDSAVLELEIERRPLLGRVVRVAASFGPMPSHPIAIRSSISAETKALVAGALTIVQGTASGLDVLRDGRLLRYVEATSANYEPLRRVAARAHCSPLLGPDSDARIKGCA
jgi:phosphonate transport system substrate-binding protein